MSGSAAAVQKKTASLKCAKKNGLTCKGVPLNKVKFVYEDNKEILNHRWVVYWVYNYDGKTVLTNPDYPGQFTVGFGRTDEDGFLYPNHGVKNFAMMTDNSQHVFATYERPDKNSGKVTFRNDQNYSTLHRFPANRDVGFIMLPADNPNLFEFTTKDLSELANSEHAWKGKITANGQVVALKRPLSEWEVELLIFNANLESALESYGKVVKDHIREIAQIDTMSTFAQYMYKFPADPKDRDDIEKVKKIVSSAENLKQKISDAFVNNMDTSTACGQAIDNIKTHAKKLWEALKNPAFAAELKRYMPYCGTSQPNGPDTRVENDWRKIHNTLEKSYSLLAKTSLGEEVYKAHCAQLFDFLESINDEFPDVNDIDSKFLAELQKKVSVSPPENSDSPILISVYQWLQFAPNIIGNSPGPASLAVGIIDAYGMFASAQIDFQNRAAQSAQALRRMFGLMKLFNLGKPVSRAHRVTLANAAKNGDLAAGRISLTKFCTESSIGNAANIAGKLFKGSMFFLAFAAFAFSVTSNEKDTLRKWANITASTGNLSLVSIGLLFSKYAASKLFQVAAVSLGVIAGIASTIVGAIDAVKAYREGDIGGVVLNTVGAIGAAAATIGFVMMTVGASTSWAGIGVIIFLAGLAVSIITAIWLFLRDVFKDNTEAAFENMRAQFTRDDGMYEKRYKHIPAIKSAYEELTKAENAMDFWELSWRAIVPLYELGFVAYDDTVYSRIPTTADLSKTAEMIDPLIADREQQHIRRILELYSESLKNSSMDKDGSGKPDAFEWLQGTILPNQTPKPLDVGF